MSNGVDSSVSGGIGRLILDNAPVNVLTIAVMDEAVKVFRSL